MLEAFGRDLSIIDVQWLPGSQTMIAVGTRQFVRIYDLSEDNISPTHNLMIVDDEITHFTFTKHDLNPI
jgi:E3 ubiquitin-protein ligase UBR4